MAGSFGLPPEEAARPPFRRRPDCATFHWESELAGPPHSVVRIAKILFGSYRIREHDVGAYGRECGLAMRGAGLCRDACAAHSERIISQISNAGGVSLPRCGEVHCILSSARQQERVRMAIPNLATADVASRIAGPTRAMPLNSAESCRLVEVRKVGCRCILDRGIPHFDHHRRARHRP